MHRRHTHLRLATAAVLTLAAAAAGCASGAAGAAGDCNAPGVTKSEIRIGLVYPDTGAVSAPLQAARAGIDARLGEINAKGGVNGRKIVYEWRDDQGTPEANAIAARDLVEHQKVFGLIESTIAAGGSAQYLNDQGVPVTGLAAEGVWSKYRNMFSFSYTTGAAVDTYGMFVKSRGGSRSVLLQTALSGGVSDVGTKIVQSMTAAGLSDGGTVGYTPGADSPTAVAQRIAASGADTLLAITDTDTLVQVLAQLRSSGHAPKVVMAVNGYDAALLKRYGAGMAGVTVPLFYRPFESGGPAITAYVDAMNHYAPQIDQPQQDIPLQLFIDADMFIRGLEEAGDCPTRQGFIDGLRSVTNYDAEGLIQPIDIAHGLGRQTTCYAFVQVNNAGTAFEVAKEQLCGKEITS
ncbi:ABC transporter substrate-binding protein [Candidatus Frankia alpina]|uniref:Branched-chain amino acid ABC transporter substrate-binding protein n=1 Tax=Candidatus Frankia alpina TaxID=2699483 RepID=A0A4S5EPQ1_9ACTN|nr:ABC transporter substrate-binding protein [Candidatus Frankia alpina]THJ74304.1 branched-chain amino acid ABC transporter substrate-binding protein [Candidatus Frankia alpina]